MAPYEKTTTTQGSELCLVRAFIGGVNKSVVFRFLQVDIFNIGIKMQPLQCSCMANSNSVHVHLFMYLDRNIQNL